MVSSSIVGHCLEGQLLHSNTHNSQQTAVNVQQIIEYSMHTGAPQASRTSTQREYHNAGVFVSRYKWLLETGSVWLRWVDDTWNVGTWRHQYCHTPVPPCLSAALKLSSVSTSPPIKACFSAVTKHLSAHKLLPAWLLLVWFVVRNIPIVVGHPHLQISTSFDSTSCTDTHVQDMLT